MKGTKVTKVTTEQYNDAMDEFIKAVGLRATAEHFDSVVRACVLDVISEDAHTLIQGMMLQLKDEVSHQFAGAEAMASSALDKLADKALDKITKEAIWGEKYNHICDRVSQQLASWIVPLVMEQLGDDLSELRHTIREKVLQQVGEMSGRELENAISMVLKKELLIGMDKLAMFEQRIYSLSSKAERRLQTLEGKSGLSQNFSDSLLSYEVPYAQPAR